MSDPASDAANDVAADRVSDLDPDRFQVRHSRARGFAQAYVREGAGGVPLLLVHGFPETKRVWWRVIAPLAAAGFDVIVPDLRAFGDSEVGPDGLHDTVASSLDLLALLDDLGVDRVVLGAGDFGGAIAQDLAARAPERVERLVLFNSPLPYLSDEMAGMERMATGAHDYFMRQGLDGDGLLSELATEDARQRYIATFYSSRFWAHPGAFNDEAIAFHAEPFRDGEKLRASFGCYESVFDPEARSGHSMIARNPSLRTLLLFGDRAARPRRSLLVARRRPLRALGSPRPLHPGRRLVLQRSARCALRHTASTDPPPRGSVRRRERTNPGQC